jgi:hypothetical protein
VFNIDDLVDALLEEVERRSPASPPASKPLDGVPKGRRFLSEHEILRMLTPGAQLLRIPRGAILSPLAQDWLALKGVRAVSE